MTHSVLNNKIIQSSSFVRNLGNTTYPSKTRFLRSLPKCTVFMEVNSPFELLLSQRETKEKKYTKHTSGSSLQNLWLSASILQLCQVVPVSKQYSH